MELIGIIILFAYSFYSITIIFVLIAYFTPDVIEEPLTNRDLKTYYCKQYKLDSGYYWGTHISLIMARAESYVICLNLSKLYEFCWNNFEWFMVIRGDTYQFNGPAQYWCALVVMQQICNTAIMAESSRQADEYFVNLRI